MQTILTRYIAPTTHRGGRVKALCMATEQSVAKPVTVAWDYELGVQSNHAAAARKLAEKLEWDGYWIGGSLPDGTGECFVRMTLDYLPPKAREALGVQNRDWFHVA